MISLVALMPLVAASAAAGVYTGPMGLGGFRLEQPVLFSRLSREIGGREASSELSCYSLPNAAGYLWIERRTAHPNEVGSILLSRFRNCERQVTKTVAPENAWRTPEGIGLGATLPDVVAAYHQPSKSEPIRGYAFQWIIHGLGKGGARRPIGDKVLIYDAGIDQLWIAEFGFDRDRLIWLLLSKNE